MLTSRKRKKKRRPSRKLRRRLKMRQMPELETSLELLTCRDCRMRMKRQLKLLTIRSNASLLNRRLKVKSTSLERPKGRRRKRKKL